MLELIRDFQTVSFPGEGEEPEPLQRGVQVVGADEAGGCAAPWARLRGLCPGRRGQKAALRPRLTQPKRRESLTLIREGCVLKYIWKR